MAVEAAGRDVPTLTGWPVVGNLRALRTNYLGTISRADRELGGLARIVAGPPGWRLIMYSVTSPELIEEVLGSPERFGKQHPGYRELRGALGDNMLTSEGDVWHRQRRFLASVFTRRRVAESYAPVMTDEARRLVDRWRQPAATGTMLDGYPEMIKVASRVSGRILFGADMSAAADLLTRFRRVNDHLLRRAVAPHPLPTAAPTPGNRRLHRDLRQIRAIVDTLIARRRDRPDPTASDMLGLLCAARDADDPADRLTDQEVAEQAMLFLLAGHDTTAVTLSCVVLLLAQHPDWQARLQAEVDDVLAGRTPTAADLDRLPWLGRVVRETLRLFPAAHGVGRSPATDQTLAGCRIPAGSWVEVSIWGVQHSARVWPDPERFDPRRFDLPDRGLTDRAVPGSHRYAWLPFGAGARACIGSVIALTEVQLVLAAILQTYQLRTPLARTPVHAAITLLPTGSLPFQLSPRAT
ncbi:cytochrome P450 [Microlunatus elymi]|uniref:Cytochrome P450 n=1 Tax=Microlunatus elymi TaxID=2596828 RepID=A0A516PWC2_9ACTN|nr:cytochrome P450 [Microlunatus elymi]QDP95460.1 cytochrome P450 [Microlunatus elymi]